MLHISRVNVERAARRRWEEAATTHHSRLRIRLLWKIAPSFYKVGIGNRSGSCSSVFATSRFGVNHAVTAADGICLRCIRVARLRVGTDTAGR